MLGAIEGEPDVVATTPEPAHHTDVSSVRVVGRFRAVSIVGDPSVTGVLVDGPHTAHTTDGLMVIQDEETDHPGFVLFGGRRQGSRGRLGGGHQPPALRITMNPDLPLEVDITAGSAKVSDVRSPIRASITAGSGRFEGVRSPIEAGVEAGSLFVSGLFTEGSSELRCTAGRVKVEVDPDSNVAIKGKATMGRIQMPHGDGRDQQWSGIGLGQREFKIGEGRANLELEATTGSVIVEIGR